MNLAEIRKKAQAQKRESELTNLFPGLLAGRQRSAESGAGPKPEEGHPDPACDPDRLWEALAAVETGFPEPLEYPEPGPWNDPPLLEPEPAGEAAAPAFPEEPEPEFPEPEAPFCVEAPPAAAERAPQPQPQAPAEPSFAPQPPPSPVPEPAAPAAPSAAAVAAAEALPTPVPVAVTFPALVAAPPPPEPEPEFDPVAVILRGREAALSREEQILMQGVEEAATLELLCFRVATEDYAISIMDIKEIIKPREATEVPRVPGFVRGILSLRGIIIPVFDMRIRLGLPEGAGGDRERIVVVKRGEGFCGVLVDEVVQVVRIPEAGVEPPPVVLEGIDRDFVQGIGRIGGKMLILLNMEQVLDVTLS